MDANLKQEYLLEEFGLWELFDRKPRWTKHHHDFSRADLNKINDVIENFISLEKIAPAETIAIRDTFRTLILRSALALSALTYVIFLQRKTYFELEGVGQGANYLINRWFSRMRLGGAHERLISALEDFSLRFSPAELIEAQFNCALPLKKAINLYTHKAQLNRVLEAFGTNDRIIASYRPATIGIAFIFGTIDRKLERELSTEGIVVAGEYMASANLPSQLCRTAGVDDGDKYTIRTQAIPKLYDSENDSSWAISLHNRLKAADETMPMHDQVVVDLHFNSLPAGSIPYTLEQHSNGFFGQIGMPDHLAEARESSWLIARVATMCYGQLGFGQMEFLRARNSDWKKLLYKSVLRAIRDNDYSGGFYQNATVAVSLPLNSLVSVKKDRLSVRDVAMIQKFMRITVTMMLRSRQKMLNKIRTLPFRVGSVVMPLDEAILKLRTIHRQTESNKNSSEIAVWWHLRHLLKEQHGSAYDKLIAQDERDLQDLANALYSASLRQAKLTKFSLAELREIWDSICAERALELVFSEND